MAQLNRMQLERRRDPQPWGWAESLGVLVLFLIYALMVVQLARAIANLLARDGFTFGPRAALFRSSLGILTGDAGAGLPPHHRYAGTTLLAVVLVLVLVAASVLYVWGLIWCLREWGPLRVMGMATRADTERVLGRTRVSKAAPVIRPDLYGRRSEDELPFEDMTPPQLSVEVDSSPLGRGLPPRFLPVRDTVTLRRHTQDAIR